MMSAHSNNRRSFPAVALTAGSLLLMASAAGVAWAQERHLPNYPRVTLSTWYEVDPRWPQRPAGVEWSNMSGVAVDAKDRVWLYTRANPPVQVYDSRGKFIRSWGEGVIGSAHHIEIDHEGMIWVADIGNHVVMRFTPEGKLLKVLGTFGEHGNDRTHFNEPTDMAITPRGDVFVSDGYGNSRVVHVDKDGKFVKAWGTLGTRPGQFSLPHAIAVDSKGRLYVADRNNARVQVFDQKGKLLDVWNNLIIPWGLWVSKKDEIWVCGSSPMMWPKDQRVLGCPPKDQMFMKFDASGKVLQIWTIPKGEDGKEKPGELNWVHGIALDSKGNIYAGDIVGGRAQKFVKRN